MVQGREWTGFEAAALQEAMRRSVRDFAALLGVETTTIANWRSGLGTVIPRSATQAILDTTLEHRATGEDRARFEQLVSEGEAAWRQRHRGARRAKTSASGRPPYDGVARSSERQVDDVQRSDFLRGLLAVSTTVLTDDVIALATEPFDTAPTRIGIDHVDRVNDWAALYRSADDAGMHVGDGMAAQLRVATGYLNADMSASVRQALHAAVGTFFRVVGWAHYDRGNHDAARTSFHAGWHCAEQAEEWWLRAAVLTCLARQAIYLNQPDDALTMLGLAAVRADRLSLLRRADIAAVQARAFGKLGDAAECLRAVDQAEQFFAEGQSQLHPDIQHEGFASYYNEALLRSDTAQGLFDLSYSRNAEVPLTVGRLRDALALTDEHARSRQLSLIRLAALQLRYGDCDEGVALGMRAIEGASSTSSVRVLDGLRLVHRAARDERAAQTSGVGELQRGLAELVHSS